MSPANASKEDIYSSPPHHRLHVMFLLSSVIQSLLFWFLAMKKYILCIPLSSIKFFLIILVHASLFFFYFPWLLIFSSWQLIILVRNICLLSVMYQALWYWGFKYKLKIILVFKELQFNVLTSPSAVTPSRPFTTITITCCILTKCGTYIIFVNIWRKHYLHSVVDIAKAQSSYNLVSLALLVHRIFKIGTQICLSAKFRLWGLYHFTDLNIPT